MVKPNTLKPVWYESFYVPIQNTADNVVNFKLFDEDVAIDNEISFVDLQIAVLPSDEITDVWLELTPIGRVKKPRRLHVLLQVALQSAQPFGK
jgi:Ca2+-dependent lipid-binding protein